MKPPTQVGMAHLFLPHGAFHFAQILSDNGYQMVEYRQGYKTMSPAMKTLMQLTLEKRIAHGGNQSGAP